MPIESYQAQICINQERIYELDDEIRKKLEDIQKIEQFRKQHQSSVDRFEEAFSHRQQKVNQTTINAERVKVFSIYKQNMTAILNERNQFIEVHRQEQSAILDSILQIEQEIENLRMRRLQTGSRIEHLQQLIRFERIKNND